MAIFIKALLLVVLAEMGDKTQLLAMVMASKFPAKKVLWGVFIATVLNHGLAVILGDFIGTKFPISYIQIIAAVLFILFGLWTIRGDSVDEEDEKKSKFGPVITVALAFFMAELGDKTQLMTITLAAQYSHPLFILLGSTTGMLIADGIGILFGTWLCKHVPDVYIKWGAAAVFIIFGIITLYKTVPASYITPLYIIPFLIILGLLIYIIGFRLHKTGTNAACEIAADSKNKNE